MGAVANAGAAAAGMGGYKLVRSDDAVGPVVDLEADRCGYPKGAAGAGSSPSAGPPSPTSSRQCLVSLDVFRGITVLVRAIQIFVPF